MKNAALIVLVAGSLFAAACEQKSGTNQGQGTTSGSATSTGTTTGSATTTRTDTTRTDNTPAGAPTQAADNTGRNERDTAPGAQTPFTQGETEADRKVAAQVRQAILDLDGLSVNAQNCKVIANNGTVTLRGPVANDQERAQIEATAKAVTGVTTVVNELEVTRG